MPLTYYCWYCRAKNERLRGRCRECGREIAAPEGTPFDELLLWALDHPLVERRMVAVRALARRRVERAREPLRALTSDADAYLAAAALDALTNSMASMRIANSLSSLRRMAPVRRSEPLRVKPRSPDIEPDDPASFARR